MSPSSLIHAKDCLADRSNRQNCWVWSNRFFLPVQYSNTRFSCDSSFSNIAKKIENYLVSREEPRILYWIVTSQPFNGTWRPIKVSIIHTQNTQKPHCLVMREHTEVKRMNAGDSRLSSTIFDVLLPTTIISKFKFCQRFKNNVDKAKLHQRISTQVKLCQVHQRLS